MPGRRAPTVGRALFSCGAALAELEELIPVTDYDPVGGDRRIEAAADWKVELRE